MNYCDDCGVHFDMPRADHLTVCEARTCILCERVFDRVIVPNHNGERICSDCGREDDLELAYDSEEENEDN